MISRRANLATLVVPRWAGWLRLAAVFVLLAGVLTMHVLATGHQPGPMRFLGASGPHHGVAVAGHPSPTGHLPAAMASERGELGCGEACGDFAGGHRPGWPHPGVHHLLDVCLGVLLAGALACLLMLARRRGRLARRAVRDSVAPTAPRVKALRPLTLSLAQLCVLRT